MTSRKFTVVLCVFLPVACACGVLFLTCAFAVEIWNHAHMYYATTENESAFLKSYEPIKVIERFCEPGQGLSYATDNSGGAGHTSVTHGAEFDFYIVMKPEKWMPLMNGLRGDLEQQLTNSGAQILSEAGSPRDGFHFQYRIGNSFGSVAILPLSLTSPSTIHRNMPLPEGMLDVTARIQQGEEWFPKPRGTIQSMVTSSIH